MQEQTYQLENVNSFELQHIFECGQCFRWNREINGSYTGVFQKHVLNVQKKGDIVTFKGICDGNIQDVCTKYFDLERDYEEIKDTLSKIDQHLEKSIAYGSGIRILNQDLWETIISFIISANNNIPRIKGIIERLSKKYGRKIEWNHQTYYSFPTVEELSRATVEDLRNLGLGFRDIRVYETTRKVLNGEVDLEKLHGENTKIAREKLLTLSGVGPKVADCILLFSTLKRFDVFPIDVWVRRVMNELYIQKPDESKVNKNEIEKLAKEKYGNLEGIAQQYLFYWKRDTA